MSKSVRSEHISGFLDFIKNVESEYKYYNDLLCNEDKMTQDLLHKLELESTGYKQRNKIATMLAISRKDRRYYKDQVEELQPMYEIISEAKYRSCLEQIKQALGKTRKAESYHKDRHYYPRILRDIESNNSKK